MANFEKPNFQFLFLKFNFFIFRKEAMPSQTLIKSQTLIETQNPIQDEYVLDLDALIGDLDWRQIRTDVVNQFEIINQQILNCDLYINRGDKWWWEIREEVEKHIENLNKNESRHTTEFTIYDEGNILYHGNLNLSIPLCSKITYCPEEYDEIIFYNIYGEIMMDKHLKRENKERMQNLCFKFYN